MEIIDMLEIPRNLGCRDTITRIESNTLLESVGKCRESWVVGCVYRSWVLGLDKCRG